MPQLNRKGKHERQTENSSQKTTIKQAWIKDAYPNQSATTRTQDNIQKFVTVSSINQRNQEHILIHCAS